MRPGGDPRDVVIGDEYQSAQRSPHGLQGEGGRRTRRSMEYRDKAEGEKGEITSNR